MEFAIPTNKLNKLSWYLSTDKWACAHVRLQNLYPTSRFIRNGPCVDNYSWKDIDNLMTEEDHFWSRISCLGYMRNRLSRAIGFSSFLVARWDTDESAPAVLLSLSELHTLFLVEYSGMPVHLIILSYFFFNSGRLTWLSRFWVPQGNPCHLAPI